MATRYGLTGTVAVAGAAILAALIALSPSERAQSLGLTRHGQLVTAQDAGAADAVATVAVTPGTAGQVLTVSDAGLPHWAAAPSGGVTVTAYDAADFTLVNGTGTASLVGGRLRLTQTADTTAWYGYVSSVWQSAPGPYAWLAIPAGAREVVAAIRVYTGSPSGDYRLVASLLRNGADPSAAPTAPTPTVGSGAKLLGSGTWGHGSGPAGSWDSSYPASSSLGAAWSSTPGATTRWLGVRWIPGSAIPVACDSADTPAIGALAPHPLAGAVVPAWGAPTMLVIPLSRLVGGSAGTSTVDLDVVVWVTT